MVNRFRQGLAAANLRQLDQHRQIDAGNHLHLSVGQGQGEVGGRAAQNIGQQHHAIALVHGADALTNIAAPAFHIVLRTNANGGDGALRAHHMLHGQAQLLSQAAMGDEDKADHWGLLAIWVIQQSSYGCHGEQCQAARREVRSQRAAC